MYAVMKSGRLISAHSTQHRGSIEFCEQKKTWFRLVSATEEHTSCNVQYVCKHVSTLEIAEQDNEVKRPEIRNHDYLVS